MAHLPDREGLDTEALGKLFEDTATSYKHLFFLALLYVLKRENFSVLSGLDLKDLAIEMLVLAWNPYRDGMSFGTQDRIIQKLRNLKVEGDPDINEIRRIIKERADESLLDLMRYVPFRLVRPFFHHELSGLPDQKVNSKILELLEEMYEAKKPLYRFNQDKKKILVHPDWEDYIRNHFSSVEAWTTYEWEDYLQRINQINANPV